MSITVKIMNDTHPRRGDDSISARFKLVHIPDGGSFQINKPERRDPNEDIAAESPLAFRTDEGYCTLSVFGKDGSDLGARHIIDGNMYVMDNGKTISSFWGTTYSVDDPKLDECHPEEIKEDVSLDKNKNDNHISPLEHQEILRSKL